MTVAAAALLLALVLGSTSNGAAAARPMAAPGPAPGPWAGLGMEAEKQLLQTSRPYNIAHRGSNGEFPEETAAAYLRAVDEGADFIEADVAATKDGHLVCFHDMTLDDTTDVAAHPEFAGRRRTLEVQWANVTGFFISACDRSMIRSLTN